jgi:hypothetical protein
VSVVTVGLYKYMAVHNFVQQFACTACSDMYRPFVQSDCLVHGLRCGAWKEDGTGRERKGREAKVSHPQPQTGSGRSGARRNRRIQPSRFLNLSPAMDDSAGSIPRHSTATVPGLTLPVCPWQPCGGGRSVCLPFRTRVRDKSPRSGTEGKFSPISDSRASAWSSATSKNSSEV